DRQPQLLGDRLGQRRARVLTDLDLAGVDRDLAVFADVQPGADVLRPLPAEAALPAAAGLLRVECVGGDETDDEAAAHAAEEVAAVEVEVVLRLLEELVPFRLDLIGRDGLPVHRSPPFITSAALRTACIMRW